MGFLGIHVCHAGLSRMVATAHVVRNESPRSCWVVLPSISNPASQTAVLFPAQAHAETWGCLPLSRYHPRILAG